jgi:plasmid replication initiation protein
MLSLNGIYAKIDLVVIKGLKSKYSIILYELLKDYENVEIPEMTIEQFRDLFGVKNKYKLFQNLKQRVIEPAINEINENKNIKWMVRYELYKTASKYTHIKFIKTIKNKQKQIKGKENSNIDKFLNKLPEQLRSSISIRKTINKYISEPERIERNIKYFFEKYNNNQIDKPATYLIFALEKDYALRTFEEEQQQRAKELKQKQREAEEKKVKEMLKKEKDELLKEAEKKFNSLTDQEKEELFKKFNKGMFFSPEIQKDIVIGELFYQICREKEVNPDKFMILNT